MTIKVARNFVVPCVVKDTSNSRSIRLPYQPIHEIFTVPLYRPHIWEYFFPFTFTLLQPAGESKKRDSERNWVVGKVKNPVGMEDTRKCDTASIPRLSLSRTRSSNIVSITGDGHPADSDIRLSSEGAQAEENKHKNKRAVNQPYANYQEPIPLSAALLRFTRKKNCSVMAATTTHPAAA